VSGAAGVLYADSVTDLSASSGGAVVACGSHGGTFTGQWARACGVRGIIMNDAGFGLDDAGVSGVRLLAEYEIPAVAVAHWSARIGYATDSAAGVVSFANSPALELGCVVNGPASLALSRMRRHARAGHRSGPAPAATAEQRFLLRSGPAPVWALDSASLVTPADAGSIVVTGSHGGLVGGLASRALKALAFAAVFNDAGGGRAGAGWSRLPALDKQGIAAATASAHTSRIGDGRSTLHHGVISRVNETSRRLGAQPGISTREYVDVISQARLEGRLN
jgi:hypothetical protein